MRKLVLVMALAGLLTAFILPAPSAVKPVVKNGLPGIMPIPADNPLTPEKIQLGKQLFFDARLSSDCTVSCATCHSPEEAWADRDRVSSGVGHKLGKRNSPTVLNAGYSKPQFWDGRAVYLEKQAVGPVENPLEMDLPMDQLLARINSIPGYRMQFMEIFGTPATADNMAKAIASFERTIINPDSPYDQYVMGDEKAMSPAALRGLKLFESTRLGCTNCHSGGYFSDFQYHNLGIGYKNGKYSDVGRYDVTKDQKDMGAFLTPTLRNVEVTYPYMHDGSLNTLMDVINIYNQGGIPNPNLDKDIKPLNLTNAEKADLVEFLKSLTGQPVVVSKPILPK
jgi:cytochrome c peroxidase